MIKVYDGARKDLKLPETIQAVRQRLPVILDTLIVLSPFNEPPNCLDIKSTFGSTSNHNSGTYVLFSRFVLQQTVSRFLIEHKSH